MHQALAVFAWALLATTAFGADPQTLADRIDARLDAQMAAANVRSAPPADDAEFLRRAYLDIAGRIPASHDVYDFLADRDPDKRVKLIDELLDSPRYAVHFASVWRAALVPETSAVAEARIFQSGFDAWLRLRFRSNAKYDDLVRELLTTPIVAAGSEPQPVLLRPDAPNPLAFYAVKEAKPENLAAATSRVFLGIQIECAQCHDHPFARWTQDQFWNTAAFFAGVERQGDGMFAPVAEATARRTIALPLGKKTVSAAFLDETPPAWQPGVSPRVQLAAWVTAKGNPFFARTAANRVWGLMFGRGIVDPVDDFNNDNPPSHPELLDDLAAAFADSGFDIKFLIRAIGRTKAYRRTSARSDPTQDDPKAFARMAVKGLTGEQFYDSIALATGHHDQPTGRRRGPVRPGGRDQFLTQFALTGKPAEPETSIPQALTLMNGRLVDDAIALDTSPTLAAACETPGMTVGERVEMLYVATVSRRPTPLERDRLLQYIDEGGTERRAERLGDVFWTLLNAAEFRLNH